MFHTSEAAVGRNMQAIHEAEAAVGSGLAKANLDKIESEINVQKRNLLQVLSNPAYEKQFRLTKAVLLQSFMTPQSISKREFSPDSKIVRIAADLNKTFHDLTEKREKLQNKGLAYKLEALKKQGQKSLFDEKILAQYNFIAQQEWHDRLLEELLHGRKVSEIQRRQDQINGRALETDFPDQDPEDVTPDWLDTQKKAEELVKKYGQQKPGYGEPHIVDQINHVHQEKRNDPKFESEFKKSLFPEIPKDQEIVPKIPVIEKHRSNSGEAKKPKDLKEIAENLSREKPYSESSSNEMKNNPTANRDPTPKVSPPPTPKVEHPVEPKPSQEPQIKLPTPEPSMSHSQEGPSELSPNLGKSKYSPPQIRAGKQEINDVLGDSFPAEDFNELSDAPLAEDDMAMFMPDSQLRTVGTSQVKPPARMQNSAVVKPPPKLQEFDDFDIGDFDDLDDF